MARIFMALLAAVLLMGNTYRDQAAELLDRNKDAEALALLKDGAAKGDATAIDGLAWMYETGRVVVRDTAEAARLYRLAAEAGEAHAQWRLGVMIDMGEAPGTAEEAVRLLTASADQGYSNAMASLAVMYAVGNGVPQDFAQTIITMIWPPDGGTRTPFRGWDYSMPMGKVSRSIANEPAPIGWWPLRAPTRGRKSCCNSAWNRWMMPPGNG